MKNIIFALSIAMVLAGCGDKEYDSSYYKSNPEKADEILKKCASGDVNGQNCENARAGLDSYKAQKLKDHLLGKDKTN